jgi:hypothetical protein
MNKMSVHDNLIKEYCVSSDKKTIFLHTEYKNGKSNEKTDVVFIGVEAYLFYRDNMQTILFDIIEKGIEEILDEFADEFADGIKYCWPGSWNESINACNEHLNQQQCRAWIISSSYGMGGFVIAKNMELKPIL